MGVEVEGRGEVGQRDATFGAETARFQRENGMIPREDVLVVVLEAEAERRVGEGGDEVVWSWRQVMLSGGDVGGGQSVL